MASEMAEEGCRSFERWISKQPEDAHSSYEIAFLSWLRQEGLVLLGEQYGLAVQTLLLVLTRHPADLPIANADDPGAWDFISEPGFALEVYNWGRESRHHSGD